MTWNSTFPSQDWLLLHKILLFYDNATILAHVSLLSSFIARVTLRWQCMLVQELCSAGTALVRWHYQALLWLVKGSLTAFTWKSGLICIMKEVGFICCAVWACSCISASLLAPQSCLPLSYISFSSFRITLTAASPALLTSSGGLT